MNEGAIKKVALRIRERRRALGFTQESFAHHAHLARSYYGRVEQGAQNVALETLFHIAAYLEMAPSELLADVTIDDCKKELHRSREAPERPA